MFERLADLETELEKLESRLPEVYASGDQRAARDAGRRHAELRPIVDTYRDFRSTEADLADAQELLTAEPDSEMREYLRGEIADKEQRLAQLAAGSASCSSRTTPTTVGTSSSRFAAPKAARKRTSGPPTWPACTSR